ncbi:MAG: DinB family protein [Nocardioidaceae bacterium]
MSTTSGPEGALLDGPGVAVSDPEELLVGYLDWYRQTLARKLAGLSDHDLRTPLDPLGWSPLGLLQHLTWVERRWMHWGFLGEDIGEPWPAGGDVEEWTITAETSTEAVFAGHAAAVAHSSAIVAEADLHQCSATGGRFATSEQAPPLIRILFHLLQEYARHAGHLDIARQLIDGETGE